MGDFFEIRREIVAALDATRDHQAAVRGNAAEMGALLVGHLRYLGPCTLAKLKRELRDFNIHTGNWKED